MQSNHLFRTEASLCNNTKWLGDILLTRPKLFIYLVLASVAFLIGLVGLIFCAEYTRRTTVIGQLMPDLGVVKVYAPQFGIVVTKRVNEGQVVRRGEVLYILSGEKRSNQNDFQKSVSFNIRARQSSITDEMQKTLSVQSDDIVQLKNKIANFRAESLKIDNQINVQKARVALSEEAMKRWQDLSSQHYVSKEQVQQRQADMLDQQSKLQTLERDSLSISRELAIMKANLANLPLRQQNSLAQLNRLLMSVKQELAESEVKRNLDVTAPENGVATAVLADLGQTVDPTKVIVSIIPTGAKLKAYLFAPSRTIGFLKLGDAVLLRYQAFPFQKFGHAKGIIESISRAAIQNDELAAYGTQPVTTLNNREPVFRITVKLDSETIVAYGKSRPLQAGMLLDADIMQETRKIYEWLIEPLYSITGRM